MTNIPFKRDLTFDYGRPADLSPFIRRVVARNPSMFTLHGTGTYIVGRGKVAIIDPGPDLPEHIDSLLEAVRGETVTDIVITHTHIDHSPATPSVKAATGATTWGFGPHGTPSGTYQVEEGADRDFVPDYAIGDGDVVSGDGWSLEAIHTPGHTSNHLCLALREENIMFSGDHVMGWSTSVISPPDGDMGDYLQSLRKLMVREEIRYWPTHGPAIENPRPFVGAFIDHREKREVQILTCLDEGLVAIPSMVERLYTKVDPRLYRAAGRSVLAHLIHMVNTGRAKCEGKPEIDTLYHPIQR
ncbi:MAG: Hydroxyacylglutathione hydrolase [Alphaproteobacteria bacterium MarineAlpha9_Bin5]|nr:MAG: Hydroxyacylglutathione hydrolase [Alphaproteobacteria bacterium MarineAlpha9_Bin6]PPR36973.1 MAG: Hydroxyacylglutathione hydrolase [Alphaproteobacteria bacterium MarineAlpha9_Bin5]